MKKSSLIFFFLFLLACGDAAKRSDRLSEAPAATTNNITSKMSVVRDINLLPIGDDFVVSNTQAKFNMDIVAASAAEASLDGVLSPSMENAALSRYLEKIEYIRSNVEFEKFLSDAENYRSFRTIWRSDEQNLILARLASANAVAERVLERTDLLVMDSDGVISDGLTVFYQLAGEAATIAQAFYIDANQQIWLKGYQGDSDSAELIYVATFVILPSGKIRKIMSDW